METGIGKRSWRDKFWLGELVRNSFGRIGTFLEVWLFFLSSVEIEAVPKVFFVVFGRLGVGDGGVVVILCCCHPHYLKFKETYGIIETNF